MYKGIYILFKYIQYKINSARFVFLCLYIVTLYIYIPIIIYVMTVNVDCYNVIPYNINACNIRALIVRINKFIIIHKYYNLL